MKWGSRSWYEWLYAIFKLWHRFLPWAYSCVCLTVNKMQIEDIWWAVPCLRRRWVTHERKFWLHHNSVLLFLVQHCALNESRRLERFYWLWFNFIDASRSLSNILLMISVTFNHLVSLLIDKIVALKLFFGYDPCLFAPAYFFIFWSEDAFNLRFTALIMFLIQLHFRMVLWLANERRENSW